MAVLYQRSLDSLLYICYNSNTRTFVRTKEEIYCQMKRINYNYITGHQDTGELPIQPWVEWKHISIGKTHCDICLKLDKCWFAEANMPQLPQHEYCHCTTVPKSILTVQKQATSVCAYDKFANYILNPLHPYNKGRAAMFEA